MTQRGEPETKPGRRSRGGRGLLLLGAALLIPTLVIGVTAAASGTPRYAATVQIDIHYSHYQLSSVSVPVGVPVRFVIRNLDPIDHEWLVGEAAVHAIHRTAKEMHHGSRPTEISIAALQTVETIVTFRASGTLQYICHLPGHEAYGMVGTLTIR